MASPMIAVICRTSELAETGAFHTQDIDGTPVLVTRDGAAAIRALVNICRHQGARVVHERSGVTKAFTCILHGWTYDPAGTMGGGVLAKLAQNNPMLATLQATNALRPLPCTLRHGFVWVGTAEDVALFLGPLDAELAARGVEQWAIHERSEVPSEGGAPLRFELGDDRLSVLSVRRRRAETDFGMTTFGNEIITLERLVLITHDIAVRRPKG
jgi:phenylpropionate dioxygenase-like ring-hydroxylating dioxygenase large terminal subunit